MSRIAIAVLAVAALVGLSVAGCSLRNDPGGFEASGNQAGEKVAIAPAFTRGVSAQGVVSENEVLLPIQQRITPVGKQIVLEKQRPQGVAWHPEGKYFVASGFSQEVLVVDPDKAQITKRARIYGRGEPPAPGQRTTDLKPMLSFHGLIFSPKGDRLYLANVQGYIQVFRAGAEGDVDPLSLIKLDPVEGLDPVENITAGRAEIPAGLAVSGDGARLYAALNLSNRLAEIEATSGRILRTFDVGVAPYDVALARNKAYVSCWGGRRPTVARDDAPAPQAGPAGRWTRVRIDAHGVASEGSVSVIDLAEGKVIKEVLTGLHASALALSPNGNFLCVANANSDSVSVIDTKRDEIVQTIPLNWQPRGYFGASPNGLCFSPDGKYVYVCNGTQNCVAVVRFEPGESKLAGLIPVGWYPGDISVSPKSGALAVANIKGIGSGGFGQLHGGNSRYRSLIQAGSLTILPAPTKSDLEKMTAQVLANCRAEIMQAAMLPPRAGEPPRAVPQRAGEPSVIKHVIYIIKENRTYDQVLGDMPEGNGDKSLCTYGEEITPNQHKICRQFVLLDNLYCCGVLSADGHQWATTAMATDYVEKQFAAWPRSYPTMKGYDGLDALAYSPKGFIWDAAIGGGRTVRVYGECSGLSRVTWEDSSRKGTPGWLDHLSNWEKGGREILYEESPGVPSLEGRFCPCTVGWNLSVPDVARAERFIEELHGWERTGDMPNLCVMELPSDHTSGVSPGMATPAAMVADNDLAVGRVVSAVSHSRFWPDTVVFAVEDDPQDGWDHVSAYRTAAYVAGGRVRRGAVVHEFYSQNSILRTIELILGLPPMTQLDAIATPMTECFQDQPDPSPFESVANKVPLTQMNPKAREVKNGALRRDALDSARLDFSQPDKCPEGTLNRILWRAAKGPGAPYPESATLKLVQDDD